MAGNRSVLNLRGEQGTLALADGQAEGQFINFVALTDVVITEIVMPEERGDVADYYGITYPQGFIFDGPFTDITITGTAKLYLI